MSELTRVFDKCNINYQFDDDAIANETTAADNETGDDTGANYAPNTSILEINQFRRFANLPPMAQTLHKCVALLIVLWWVMGAGFRLHSYSDNNQQ